MSIDRLNFNHVFYFHVVAEEGSIARAAARLHVTKSTVSEQVKLLEASLGTQLFHRRGGALELTDEGRGALVATRRMFSAATSLVERFSGSEERAVLRVGVSTSATRAVTESFFAPLFSMEGVNVILRTSSAEHVLRAIYDGELDVGITDALPLEPSRRGLAAEPLVTTPVVAVTGAGAPMPTRAILPPRDSAIRRAAQDFLEEGGQSQLEVLGETDDVPTTLILAEQLPCLAFVPRAGVRRELASGRLRIVRELSTSVAIHALFVERDRVVERIRSMVEHLRESYEDGARGSAVAGAAAG